MIHYFIFPLLVIVIWGISGSALAKNKNRNPIMWFIVGVCSGLLGLLPLMCAKRFEYDEDVEYEETDTLGIVMLFISIMWMIFSYEMTFSMYRQIQNILS